MTHCLSGTKENQCLNTNYLHVGFFTISTSGSDGNPFSTISALGINNAYGASSAAGDVVPNGSVGNDQYMLFANNYVQAFDKGTHKPIFVGTSTGTTAQPQTANTPWNANGGSQTIGPGYCNQESDDFDVVYDPVDGVWVLAGNTRILSGTNVGHRDMCIATSAGTDNLYTCSSGTCPSYWNAYAFDLTDSSGVSPAIFLPSHNGNWDLADYPRFGVWKDGYYMTFDLINQGTANPGQIDGFAVCKLDSANISGGNAASAATCYVRYPSPTAPPLIHTLLPANMETSSSPSGTQGEYFLATVNPGTADGSPCKTSPCTSTSLAYWTWSGSSNGITNETAPTTVTVNTFTPGCYSTSNPTGDTFCIPQPDTSSNELDSVGDRLMSPLAYRYIPSCNFSTPTSCEVLAITQTVNEGSLGVPPTGIRYYKLAGPASPSTAPVLEFQGDITDSNLYYWVASNAIDKNSNIAYTFSGGDASLTGCSGGPLPTEHLLGWPELDEYARDD